MAPKLNVWFSRIPRLAVFNNTRMPLTGHSMDLSTEASASWDVYVTPGALTLTGVSTMITDEPRAYAVRPDVTHCQSGTSGQFYMGSAIT